MGVHNKYGGWGGGLCHIVSVWHILHDTTGKSSSNYDVNKKKQQFVKIFIDNLFK